MKTMPDDGASRPRTRGGHTLSSAAAYTALAAAAAAAAWSAWLAPSRAAVSCRLSVRQSVG